MLFKKSLFFLIVFFAAWSISAAQEISGDVFGKQKRHYHPGAALGFEYTDNLYNTKSDKESDFTTVFSPSIAFSAPGSRDVELILNSETGAPGGLALSRDTLESTDKYLAYLIYNPKAEWYAENSRENMVSHNAKAAGQLNFSGGLLIDMAVKYATASEKRGEVGKRETDEYEDILYNLIIRYDVSPKLFFEGSFSGYKIDYDLSESQFRNRDDLSWSLSAGYRISPKTSFSLEYQRADVDYDKPYSPTSTANYYHDNTEEIYSANVSWDITAKSKGKFKIGSSEKELDSGESSDDLFMELNLNHSFTTRTSVQFAAARRFYETNFGYADFYVSDRISIFYNQELSSRINGKINFYFTKDDYSGVDLKNKIYEIGPSLEYNLNDWFSAETGYLFETRDSNYSVLEYDTNRFYLSFNAEF
ncbi:MAG: outer membrane beta-barrel protein [Desulforegulaceae bacterium]|nr:outer membrane beta-barrel protein [Desulforegulaceae bacterium]